MDGMDGMDGGDMGSGQMVSLSAAGVDFSNETQAMDFLGELLDDTILQHTSNYYARAFWYGTAVVVVILAMVNFGTILVHRSRLRAAAAKHLHPAKPTNPFLLAFATATAVAREATYLRITPLRTAFWFKAPSFGTIILLLIYLGFILGLEFTNSSVPGAQYYQALGIRAAWLAVAQVPLVILLAGKNNIIGLFTGQSFERLNVLHRWVSRGLLLMATLHFGYQSYGWNIYSIMQLEWDTDSCPPTGIAAYALLLWLNLSTLAPLRNWNYEFFVVQHLLTFFGFIIALMMHLPSTALYSRVYIYIAIALYIVDRLIRTGRNLYHNYRPSVATLIMPAGVDGVTKVVVQKNNRLTSWKPGSYVLLSIPKFGIAQSHPLTIASTPTSHNGDLVFLMRSHKGFTKRVTNYVAAPAEFTTAVVQHRAFIDGPYGASQADFAVFDTALLIAGGSGITFCVSVLLDLADRCSRTTLPLRTLRLIWMVKTSKFTGCFACEIQSAIGALLDAGIDARVDVCVTCDETIADTKEEDTPETGGCQCEKNNGRCCCSGPEDTTFSYTPNANTSATNSSSSIDSIVPTPHQDLDLEKAAAVQASTSSLNSFTYHQKRPTDIHSLLLRDIVTAQGETGVTVCGPLGLSTRVRSEIVRLSDERAVHKGSGAQGIYLHVEEFGW